MRANRQKRVLRPLGPAQLEAVRGGISILLPALGQAKEPVRAAEYEEVAMTYQHIVWE